MLRTLFPKNHDLYERSNHAEDLEAFGVWLLEHGYSHANTVVHLRVLRRVLERAGETGNGTVYCEGRLEELFAVRDGPPARVVSHRATRRTYGRYLLARGRLAPRDATGPWERCIEEYGEFLREVRGLAATTTATHQATASDFLAHALHPTPTLDALNAAHVERYVAKKGAEVTRQTLQHTVAHLRAFLRYCFDRGLIPGRLDAMDTPRTYRGEQPPRAMPWSLVLGLLRSVDRSDPVGWRDYAMLHLMAYYGLRPSEVVALEVGAVDLDVRTLRVTQRKTASELLLPLAVPTVRVLQDYLRLGRPECGHPQLFLRARRPSGALKNTAVCNLFGKRVREYGLPPGRYSAYSLRHAFAMRLLERGVGVKAIGDLLGHRNLESTCVYLRLDMKALRGIALPVPGGNGIEE